MKKSNKLLFSTKVNTLDFFHRKIKKSRIEKFYLFTVKEWNNDDQSILNQKKLKMLSFSNMADWNPTEIIGSRSTEKNSHYM